MRKIFSLLILALATIASGASYITENIQAGRLRVKAVSEERCRSIGFFVLRCSEYVDSLIGIKEQPAKMLTIIEQPRPDGEEGELNTPYRVVLTSDMEYAETVYSIFYALLLRRELELSQKASDSKTLREASSSDKDRKPREYATVQWLAAGLSHRMLLNDLLGRGLQSPDFEVAMNQFAKEEYPSVDGLLTGGIPAEFKSLFELYMLHCHLLILGLEGLRGSQAAIFRSLLQAENENRKPLEAFDEAFKVFYLKGELRQAFYERRVKLASRYQRRGKNNLEVIVERVAELETVQMVGGSGPEALQKIRLEEMPKVLEDYKADKRALMRLQQQFRDVRDEAPYWLKSPLEEYVLALQDISDGHIRRFKKGFAKAREHFQQAVDKHRELEAYIQEYERKQVAAKSRLDEFIEIIGRYLKYSNSIYPNGSVFVE